jgi:hypothetical protein
LGLWLVKQSRDEALILITMVVGVELIQDALRLNKSSSWTAIVIVCLALAGVMVQYANYLRETKATDGVISRRLMSSDRSTGMIESVECVEGVESVESVESDVQPSRSFHTSHTFHTFHTQLPGKRQPVTAKTTSIGASNDRISGTGVGRSESP